MKRATPSKRGSQTRRECVLEKYGKVFEVSVSVFEEEFFLGRELVSSRGLSRGRRGGGGRQVFCDGYGIGREGRLDNRLYDVVDVHTRR